MSEEEVAEANSASETETGAVPARDYWTAVSELRFWGEGGVIKDTCRNERTVIVIDLYFEDDTIAFHVASN